MGWINLTRKILGTPKTGCNVAKSSPLTLKWIGINKILANSLR